MKIKAGLVFLVIFIMMEMVAYGALTVSSEAVRAVKPKIALDGGYFGGAIGIKAGLMVNREILQMRPRVYFGYGVGHNYGVTLFQAELANYDNPYSFGVTLDLATYSLRVMGIPGLPDVIEKGTRTGFGGFVGKQIRGFDVKFGYSTALGYVLSFSKQIEPRFPVRNKK